MGEHGDSSFVPWDHAYLGCKKIKDVMKDNHHPMEDLKKIHQGVINAAYEIITQMRYINCNIIGSLGYENVEDYPDYLTVFLDSIAKKYNVEEDEVYEL